VIPELETDRDPSGLISTYQPGGATLTSRNPFFQNLGTNGRTCFTCHQPQNGWTISAQSAHDRFFASKGTDPLFRLVDGATCPSDDVSTPAARQKAYQLLIDKGLIRIGLAIPSNPKFTVTVLSDPYGCNTDPTTGLTSRDRFCVSPPAAFGQPGVSQHHNVGWPRAFAGASGARRDLGARARKQPRANHRRANTDSKFREWNFHLTDLRQPGHAVAGETIATDPDGADPGHQPAAMHGIVGCTDRRSIRSRRAAPEFLIGVNDPFGLNPCGTPFTADIFDLYQSWTNLPDNDPVSSFRKSVARGEEVFNTKPITITGVAGINDVLNQPSFTGNCATCHDTPNIGNHSVKAPLNIGITDANPVTPLDVTGLPVFAVTCTDPSSPLFGRTLRVTDPGRALISGNCADIGKTKGPILRGLAARAPYFHNGSAATLSDAVEFYDQRFNVGFTDQEKQDLANFLATL
jgi:hypothetical protein